MTKLASAGDRAGRAAPAPPQSPASNRQRSPAGALADPRVRLAAGTAVMLATAIAARRHRVGPGETAAFRVVNGLPDALYPPAWIIMQLGTLGAAPAAAAVAWLAGDRKLAGRLLVGGIGTWAASKLVKRMVGRPRPATLLPGTHRRGPDAAGLGYLSGHAGVAVALGAAALPRLGPAGRALTLAAIPTVGLTRVYVGAHLPLDTAGGAALGLAVDAALALAQGRARSALLDLRDGPPEDSSLHVRSDARRNRTARLRTSEPRQPPRGNSVLHLPGLRPQPAAAPPGPEA